MKPSPWPDIRCGGLVIDAAPPFMAAHLNFFARLPLQLCRIHASRRLDFDIPKAKSSPDAPRRAELKDRARRALFAPDAATARRHIGRPRLRTALGSKVLAAVTRSAPWSDDSSATRPTTTCSSCMPTPTSPRT